MPIAESNASPKMNFTFLIYALSESLAFLQAALEPLLTRLNSTPGLEVSVIMQESPSYHSFQSVFLAAAPVGMNRVTAGRLWDSSAVEDTVGVTRTLRIFSNQFLQGTFVSGEGVQNKSADNSALHPSWRRTVVHMSKWLYRVPSS